MQLLPTSYQVFNRDLSVLMLQLFAERRLRDKAAREMKRQNLSMEETQEKLNSIDWASKVRDAPIDEGMTVLDALAASGLRSIRYIKEVPGVKEVVVNDLEPAAVEQAKRNVEFNKVDPTRVRPQEGDAILVMYQNKRKFDVVDIDPYGSAAPFMDAAMQAVVDGGLLCVTCTDLSVLNGNYPEVCFSKYRSIPAKASYMHEMAVRIVLAALESAANQHQRHIVPILSVCVDFYLRCFVRVYTSKAEVKKSCLKQSYVYQSVKCPNFYLQPVGRFTGKNYQANYAPSCPQECPETGGKLRMGGPFWSDPVHDMEWVDEALKRITSKAPGTESMATTQRLQAILTVVSEELPDVPLFYNLDDLCSTLRSNCPKLDDIKWAIMNAGYRVSAQHKDPKALKTDAPPEVMWDIMRCWVKKHPIHANQREKKGEVGYMILAKEPKLEANFNRPASLNLRQYEKKVPRFLPNPEAFWGPKARAFSSKRKWKSGGKEATSSDDEGSTTQTTEACSTDEKVGKKAHLDGSHE